MTESIPTPKPDPPPHRGSRPAVPSRVWGMTRGDQMFLLGSSLVVLMLLGANILQRSPLEKTTVELKHLEPQAFRFQIEINEATWVEWMQLDGIGETTGRNIVDDREVHGPFSSVADVQRVKGIGTATMTKIRPFLRCADCEGPQETGEE